MTPEVKKEETPKKNGEYYTGDPQGANFSVQTYKDDKVIKNVIYRVDGKDVNNEKTTNDEVPAS